MELDVKVRTEVVMPEVPEELNLTNGAAVTTSSLGIRQLRAIGREWTEALIAKSREENNQDPQLPN